MAANFLDGFPGTVVKITCRRELKGAFQTSQKRLISSRVLPKVIIPRKNRRIKRESEALNPRVTR